MAVIVLTSAAGAPGTTTAALALAAAWPSPALLVEGDACGASAMLSGLLRGQVAATCGVVDAAVAVRRDRLTADLPALLIPLPDVGVPLLAGIATPAQRATMVGEWPRLGPELVDYAMSESLDLLVDAGRLGAVGFPTSLLAAADVVLVVTRSTLRGVHATSAWLPVLSGELPDPGRIRLLLVGDPQPYTAREISRHLQTPVIERLAWDPGSAAVLSDGAPAPRRPGRLAPSARDLALALHLQGCTPGGDHGHIEVPESRDGSAQAAALPTSSTPAEESAHV